MHYVTLRTRELTATFPLVRKCYLLQAWCNILLHVDMLTKYTYIYGIVLWYGIIYRLCIVKKNVYLIIKFARVHFGSKGTRTALIYFIFPTFRRLDIFSANYFQNYKSIIGTNIKMYPITYHTFKTFFYKYQGQNWQ